jgi:hypothetical protein
MSHGNDMICQSVTLSGDAEWPKVADAVIEATDVMEKRVVVFGLENEPILRHRPWAP